MNSHNQQNLAASPNTWRAAKAVFWGFFGVRRSRDHIDDVTHLTLIQIIIAGVIGGILFVGTLLSVVNWVVP
jgi:hypothetical protein